MKLSRSVIFFASLLIITGLAAVIYLFGKEEVQNVYNQVINPPEKVEEPGPITADSLYEAVISKPIDWALQMAKIRDEGFNGKPFIADIRDLNLAEKSFILKFDLNYGEPLPDVREIVSKNSCQKDKTYVISSLNLTPITQNVDLFSLNEKEQTYARAGDILISSCRDESCSSIGDECIVIRIESQNESQ